MTFYRYYVFVHEGEIRSYQHRLGTMATKYQDSRACCDKVYQVSHSFQSKIVELQRGPKLNNSRCSIFSSMIMSTIQCGPIMLCQAHHLSTRSMAVNVQLLHYFIFAHVECGLLHVRPLKPTLPPKHTVSQFIYTPWYTFVTTPMSFSLPVLSRWMLPVGLPLPGNTFSLGLC